MERDRENYVVVKLSGRCGNQFYQIATGLAYSYQYNSHFFVTSDAQNCDNDAYYFTNFPKKDKSERIYSEDTNKDNAIYNPLPYTPNVMLIGYWQTFEYFNNYREKILKEFNLPYKKMNGHVSLHVRRGDYLHLQEKLSILTTDYYTKAIKYFLNIGYSKFLVFSDDIDWCKNIFDERFLENACFDFSENRTELEDLSLMASCEHNIVANSTFSYAASWLNQNTDKIVITPANMFGGCNNKMIPKTYIII